MGNSPKLDKAIGMEVKCPVCSWQGTLKNALSNIDGEGSPGCPVCLCNVIAVKVRLKRNIK